MILPAFHLHRPKTLQDALAAARDCAGDFDYVAGGTDLLQNYKNRLNARGHLIDVTGVAGLDALEPGRIGALVRLADLEAHPEAAEWFPGLLDAVRQVASPLVRQTATVGGNLLVDTRCWYFNQSPFWREAMTPCLKAEGCTCLVVPNPDTCYATFSGDLAPAFMVLDAGFVLEGPGGARTVPAAQFYRGDGIERHVKQPEEILTQVEVPESSRRLRAGYRKLRVRDTLDYPLMGVAAALRMENGVLAECRVVVNAVDTTPLAMDAQVAPFLGQPFGPEARRALAEDVRQAVTGYKNVFLSVAYRKAMVAVFLERLLAELVEEKTA